MKRFTRTKIFIAVGVAIFGAAMSVNAETVSFEWKTVVDNNSTPPGVASEKFFSYNQPSVNDNALVVFRARAKPPTGGQGGGEPTRGVFTRNMANNTAIKTIASTKPPSDVVPAPNNITKPKPATFNEFPAFPRIDKLSNTVAFRAQSQPTWEDPVLGKLGGTSGVYANPNSILKTGVRNLEVDAPFPHYLVPNAALDTPPVPTRFDQFPGAPAISETNRIAFKGNYTDNDLSKTGIFFRNAIGGTGSVNAVAWSGLSMPDKGGKPTATKFGSTAPPSGANGKIVFAGFDNEENPTAGGVYLAQLKVNPELKALVTIGDDVPSITGAKFTRFGEALSFDGRYVTFWGAWGTQGGNSGTGGSSGWKEVTLTCPKDGNVDVIKSCKDQDESGTEGDGIYTLYEPINQGIFLYDTVAKRLSMIAKTNDQNGFNDFLFWSFTGAPPGVGGGDEGSTDDRELPRWRNSAFAASFERNVAFKAKKQNSNGIYLKVGNEGINTVLDTTMTGNMLDSKTIIVVKSKDGNTSKVPLSQLNITTLGLERDGFRNKRLAISASMADTSATYSWAGIYLGKMDDDEDDDD